MSQVLAVCVCEILSTAATMQDMLAAGLDDREKVRAIQKALGWTELAAKSIAQEFGIELTEKIEDG